MCGVTSLPLTTPTGILGSQMTTKATKTVWNTRLLHTSGMIETVTQLQIIFVQSQEVRILYNNTLSDLRIIICLRKSEVTVKRISVVMSLEN